MAAGPFQLLVAIVQDKDVGTICDGLIAAGFPGPTRVASTGGFLQQGNSTLLVGIEAEQTTEALRVIAAHSRTRSQFVSPLPPFLGADLPGMDHPVEVHVGAATVFILDVERFERW